VIAADVPIDRLPDVVLGRDRSFGRAKAMAQLAASPRPDREALLAQVLENTYEPRRYKAVAAIALGRIATPTAGRVLERNLSKTWDDAFGEVLRALGHVGGPEALEALEALRLPPDHPNAATAAYAGTLIAHRLGLPGHRLPPPAERELLPAPAAGAEGTRAVQTGPADPETARAVLEDLAKQPYGIAFDPAALTLTRCAGEVNVICPNRELRGPAVARLAERNALLALVALRSAETGAYSVSYVVFSHPAGDSADPGGAAARETGLPGEGALAVSAHRCSGKLALAGPGRVVGGRLEVALRAVRHPGARAVSLRGVLDGGRFELGEALSSATQVRPRVPARHRG
jgi:hypothetical protein